MGIVSLTQFPGKRAATAGSALAPSCFAAERSEAPPLEAALLSASGRWKSADFLLESEPFPHSLCLDVGAPNESRNTQLPGSSLPPLWAAYLHRVTSWNFHPPPWPPQTLVSSAPGAPRFRLAGPAVCHRQDGQPQSRVTFQRHRDLFNFSELTSLHPYQRQASPQLGRLFGIFP